MPNDSYAAIPPNSTGPQVRTMQVQTFVNGVALTVDVQGVVLVDGDGRLIWKVQDDNWQRAVLERLDRISLQLAALTGMPAGV